MSSPVFVLALPWVYSPALELRKRTVGYAYRWALCGNYCYTADLPLASAAQAQAARPEWTSRRAQEAQEVLQLMAESEARMMPMACAQQDQRPPQRSRSRPS